MKPLLAAIAGGVAVLCVARVGARVQTQTPPVFRGGTDVVSVDVTVRSGGQAVGGLRADDFVVRDNHVVQRVEAVDAAAMPLDVTILADASGGASGAWSNGTSAARTRTLVEHGIDAIAAMLRPEDRLRVIAIDTYASLVMPLQPARQPIELRQLTSQGLSSVYDGLIAAMLAPVEPGRRHLVVAWTKAVDTISAADADQVREVARQSDAVVHVVQRDFASGPANASYQEIRRPWRPFTRADPTVLTDVAAMSGGTFHGLGVFGDASASAAFKPIFEEFRRGYVLRYSPRGVSGSGWHEIEVTVPRLPAAVIHARRGYAGAAASPTSPARRNAESLSSIRSLVETFDRGDVPATRAALHAVSNLRSLIHAYADEGARWAAAPRHEAMFVLELADTGVLSPDAATRDEALALLGRQHDLVRQPLGSDAFECAWYEAEAAVLASRALAIQTIDAATSALARCPDASGLVLARAVATDALWSTANARTAAERAGRKLIASPADVLARYDEAVTRPQVAAEAGIRSAWLDYRIGNYADAIARLDAADRQPADRVVRFFGQFVRGQVQQARSESDAAEAAYRSALVSWPGAQSARVSLMTLLLTHGQRGEAEQLADAIQAAPNNQIDPWWVYWQGAYRGFDGLMARLEELAR
jgi:tetratricopeptide (TPR) repeat protein